MPEGEPQKEQNPFEDLSMEDLRADAKELERKIIILSEAINKLKETLQYPESPITKEFLDKKSGELDEMFKQQDLLDAEQQRYLAEIERRKKL